MPRLVVKNPDGTTQELELTQEFSIGRAEGNDLILTEGGVSRRHARLSLDGGQVVVEDAASSNGTFVDGQKIDGPTALRPGAQLVIGSYTLSVVNGEKRAAGAQRSGGAAPRPGGRGASRTAEGAGASGSSSQLVPVRRATAVMPTVKGGAGQRAAEVENDSPLGTQGPQLRGLTGPWANQVFPVSGKLVIGRAGQVQVLLEDDSVSRRHAELARTSDGFVVRDLGSANGTLVNGEPVGEDEVVLKSGDVLQVGVVELVFEEIEGEVLSAPVRRRDGGLAPVRSRAGYAPPGRDDGISRQKLYVLAGVGLGALVLVVAIAKALTPDPVDPTVTVALSSGSAPAPMDSRQALKIEVDKLLAACRTYAAADPMNPEWDKAEASCQRAVEKNPIDADAVNLLARVRRDRDAHKSYVAAETAMERNDDAEALEQLQQIPVDSPYYLRAKPKALEAAEGVKKRASADCKRYAAKGFWKEAEGACESYMRIACQDMTKEDLNPPPGERLKLKGRLGKNEWRPQDPMYRNLLEARFTRDASASLWSCPELDILKRGRETSDAKDEIEKVFRERFKDRTLVAAMMDYWRGKGNDAITRLQKLLDDPDRATLHATAKELVKNIAQVHQFFGMGQGLLKQSTPEKAVKPFKEALELEGKLLLDEASARPSWYANTIRQDMATAAYRYGKTFADERRDFRQACRIWKMGLDFSTSDRTLLGATNHCSSLAKAAFDGAESCERLDEVMDLAVPKMGETVAGDGLTELAKEKRSKLNCL